jgi:hypothetical protein
MSIVLLCLVNIVLGLIVPLVWVAAKLLKCRQSPAGKWGSAPRAAKQRVFITCLFAAIVIATILTLVETYGSRVAPSGIPGLFAIAGLFVILCGATFIVLAALWMPGVCTLSLLPVSLTMGERLRCSSPSSCAFFAALCGLSWSATIAAVGISVDWIASPDFTSFDGKSLEINIVFSLIYCIIAIILSAAGGWRLSSSTPPVPTPAPPTLRSWSQRIARVAVFGVGSVVVLSALATLFLYFIEPVVRGANLRSQVVSAIENATSVKALEHSSRFQHRSAPSEEEYSEQIYASVELGTAQRRLLIAALPVSMDHSARWAKACIFSPHHRIEAVHETGEKFVMEICFECDEIALDSGGKRCMPVGWGYTLRKFFTALGMNPDGPWEKGVE